MDRDGINATVSVDKPFESAFFPEIQRGDSVEFFIDTRDSKASGFSTRFCHHIFLSPKEVDGRVAVKLRASVRRMCTNGAIRRNCN